jgi:two-component system sensor histidine kinase UhpB
LRADPWDTLDAPDPALEIRRHVARELHDVVAQALTTMLVQMENLKHEQRGSPAVLREVTGLQDSTRDALKNIRQLLYDLRGEPGVERDFVSAIRKGLLRTFQQSTGIRVRLSVSKAWPAALPSTAALNLYRILQEALSNVRQHSGAKLVKIALTQLPDNQAAVTIVDDGRGLAWVDDARLHGLGLLGMRERAMLLGGELVIENNADGGTAVRATFPLEMVR